MKEEQLLVGWEQAVLALRAVEEIEAARRSLEVAWPYIRAKLVVSRTTAISAIEELLKLTREVESAATQLDKLIRA